MSANDGLGLIVFFTVILGVIWGELKSRTKPKPINDKVKRAKKHRLKEDLNIEDSEFDGAMLFGDYLFPEEFPEFGENN